MRVLHVSEALGGGVTSAVLAMAEATPEIDHHLFARPRPSHDIGLDPAESFTTVQLMPANPLAAVAALRKVVRELFPDVVHAHSSIAGAVVRMAGLDRPSVVYTPHCFAFERRDIAGSTRRAYRAVERSLVARTDLLVAVAPHELDLAAELGHRELAYVPNRTLSSPVGLARFRRPLRIVTVGRVCAQKDWRHLVHLKRYVDSHVGVDATWEWLGDGDAEGVEALQQVGVQVSGWLPNDEVLARLTDAQIYVHTAAWEAAPISILESAAIGLPLALRSIPALDSLRLSGLSTGIADLADRIGCLADESAWAAAQDASIVLADRHSRSWQGRLLHDAYARALGADAPAGLAVVGDRPRPTARPALLPATGSTW